jgi:uncharacterized membrane protein
VRSFYWFIPSLFVGGCFGLAYLMLALDMGLGNKYVFHLSWIYTHGPEGARGLLSVISQSMITVAGVVFSITVVALTLTSNQFGTRVLKSFARDTGNQSVLGILLGTFLYGIVVMRRVEQHFIPSLSVAVAILLAIVSVAVLIYFIHHVINEIQAENVVAAVARDLYDTLDVVFPEELGSGGLCPEKRDEAEAALSERTGKEVRSGREGFVQSIDPDKFFKVAEDNDAIVRLLVRPGTFVTEQAALARFWCATEYEARVAKQLSNSISIGNQRTYEDDMSFGLQQLGLIAVRSLSPAINAMGTALDAIDRLAASLVRLGNRKIPSPYRRNKSGRLRVITPGWDFDEVLSAVLDPIRVTSVDNATVVGACIKALGEAAERIGNPELKRIVWEHVDRFADAIPGLRQQIDRQRIRDFYQRLRAREAA